MLNLNDVLTCKRIMEYEGCVIEYTTGLNDVYLNPQDCLYVMKNVHGNHFGYIQDMEDIVYLLKKNKCINKGLINYENDILVNYLYSNNINIDMIIKLSEKVNCERFTKFLNKAKTTINKYGLYVPEPKMKHYDRRRNNEMNLAETLNLEDLSIGANRLGIYEDQLYLDVADAVANIVFGNSMENVRMNYDLLYGDYLSNRITDYEYDMIAYCCKVISYLLRYSDIGVYGMEIFTRHALIVAMKEYNKPVERSEGSRSGESGMIQQIFDKAVNNVPVEDYDYEEYDNYQPTKLRKKTHLSEDEINEIKRYL